MKNLLTIAFLGLLMTIGSGCETLNQVLTTPLPPSTSEMAGGLKEALNNGIGKAVSLLGKDGGYFNDQLVKIPFPDDVKVVAKTLTDIGLGSLVTDFERKLNAGASEGAKLAGPIFANAIKGMSFNDVSNILLSGNKQAATDYFKTATSASLIQAFSPKIQQSLDKVGATKAWTDVTSAYNKIPLVKKVNTDLVGYATGKAMDGLFSKVAIQEGKIRTDVSSRSSELLKKVFGYADEQKSK
ncbi:MAG: DUF4197 domain-containing protein [Bacteroidia bacterium]